MGGRKEGSSQLPACRQKVRKGQFRAAVGWRWMEGKDEQEPGSDCGGRKGRVEEGWSKDRCVSES